MEPESVLAACDEISFALTEPGVLIGDGVVRIHVRGDSKPVHVRAVHTDGYAIVERDDMPGKWRGSGPVYESMTSLLMAERPAFHAMFAERLRTALEDVVAQADNVH
ncbi:GSKIP domain-containing protein [Plasmodiophora brassicae]|uniref:GSKIP domain-containing protein n=1 Tax=Plasmodiophora brassicae TaxID=37360 RepID=A0A0G4IPK2_PLABS|nr:hypothetical protein PBRA_000598 [Plasmodiophora brassicae]SPQ97560.1 unnamed protein product [Plasmodiophora brassicae]